LFLRRPNTCQNRAITSWKPQGGAYSSGLTVDGPNRARKYPPLIHPQCSPPLLALLRAAHAGRNDLCLSRFTEAQVQWVVANGFGPLLAQALSRDSDAPASSHWPRLRAATLTAQVLAAAQLDAMTEIIDACRAHVPPLTLLKGISLCEAHYPSPHLRPMRDIDVLVADSTAPKVHAILLGLGYREHPEAPADLYRDCHHLVPLVHRRTGIWVEVHRRLFSPRSWLPDVDPFGPERVKSMIRPSTFRGRLVTRLSDEVEVAYIASHWVLSPSRIYYGGGVVAMLDLIHLLKRIPELDWEGILAQVEGSMASTHLYLLLSYLHRHGLLESPAGTIAVERLAGFQRCLGHRGQRILHEILDRYVVDGREYRGLVTPRHVRIIWETLLAPGPSSRNLTMVLWNLLADRFRRERPLPWATSS
jgi:hypothetical protein